MSRDFLLAERARADQELETPDCRLAGCQDCGVCDQDRSVLRLEEPSPCRRRRRCPAPDPPVALPHRLTYAKVEEGRWLGHLELVAVRLPQPAPLRAAPGFSAGFHPLPRVSFHGALPLGVESLVRSWTWAWRPAVAPGTWCPA